MIPFNSYIKNILAKYPRLDNDEIISGIYTFLNTIKIKHPNAHLGTYPSTDTTYHKVSILDENNSILGDISFKAYTNGNYGIVFSLNNREFAIKVSDEGHIDLRCDYPLCGFNTGTDEVANTKYVLDAIDYKNDLLNNSIREYITSVIRYSPQTLTTAQKQQARENIGIEHVTSNSSAHGYCSRLAIGNTQILYGVSLDTFIDYTLSDKTIRYYIAMFKYPFINDPLVLGTPYITMADDNATCGAIVWSSSPRTYLFGTGSPDHTWRVLYGAIGQSFPLDENAYADTEIPPGNGRYYIQIPKENINLTSPTCYFLVDMFISSNAPRSDYIEFVGSRAKEALGLGKPRISNTTGFDGTGDLTHYTRGYDVDLSFNPESKHDDVEFMGYNDVSGRKLFTDPRFRNFKMASFIVSASSSSISGDSVPYVDLTFNRSLSNGVYGYIRVFYIPGTTSSEGSSSPTLLVNVPLK